MRLFFYLLSCWMCSASLVAYAEDSAMEREGWQDKAQEELVRIHSHYDWMGVQVADVAEEVDWQGSSPPYHQEAIRQEDFDIPIVVNASVKHWMSYYLGPARRTFEIYLARSARYEAILRAELQAGGVPEDLFYLAMIESGFVADARSRSGAAGLWQIMPGTAHKYDVRLDSWVDDRLDPIRSTQAAITLLKTLHQRWGDWYLAWAAYNGGGRRVKQGVETIGSRDFWRLARGGAFAAETHQYVPKLIAAAILGKYRERYGFTRVQYLPVLRVDTVELATTARLDVLAECARLKPDALRAMNPGLLRSFTPEEGYSLKIPAGGKKGFLSCIEEKGVFKPRRFERHVVKNGEVLSKICERYDVRQDDVLSANGKSNANHIRSGETLLIPVAIGGEADEAARTHLERPKGTSVSYLVEWGDTLSTIAVRYGVRVGQLQQWNRLTPGAVIQVGQTLTVILEGHKWKEYTVRDGDSLGKIAYRNACTVKDLRVWNGLESTFLRPGQRLRIRD